MIDDFHVRGRLRPGFRKQTDSLPQFSFMQKPTQTTYSQSQNADHSTLRVAMRGRQRFRRRPESSRSYPLIIGIFDSAAICQNQHGRHTQDQPMSANPFRVGSSALVPLPANTLYRSEAHLYPEAKRVPAHPSFGGCKVGHHHPRLFVVSVPSHDHRSATAYARSAECRAETNICAPLTRCEIPRLKASPPVRTEHGVHRLSDVRMPTHRTYLFPQSRTSHTPVAHHQHSLVLGHRRRQQSQQLHYRRYPLARSVGWQNVPCYGNGATAIYHAYDYGVYLSASHRRVYRQHQLLRSPPCEYPSEQRNKAQPHFQLRSTRTGSILPIVQPLSEILTHRVETGHERERADNRVLAATARGYGSVHPQGQSGYLRPPKVRHMVLYGLSHLVIPF